MQGTEKKFQCSRTLAMTWNKKCQFTSLLWCGVWLSPFSMFMKNVCSLAFSKNVRLISDTTLLGMQNDFESPIEEWMTQKITGTNLTTKKLFRF